MGVGVGIDTFHHALQGGAGADLDELIGAVFEHVLHGVGPTDG